MDEIIKQHLIKYAASQGWTTDDTDGMLREILLEADPVWEENTGSQRWWHNFFTVVEIDGMLIGFGSAKTTGDNSPDEAGWKFDPKSVCRVVAKSVTTTIYEKIVAGE